MCDFDKKCKSTSNSWKVSIPLIHTLLQIKLAQDMVYCQCKQKAPTDQYGPIGA